MKELSIEELRSRQVRVLNQVVDFCEEQGLRYFLCGGTLLGAVRHKGYIPWDDDIDIMMPREDYDKLIFNFKVDGLTMFSSRVRGDYYYPFAKVSDDETVIYEHMFLGQSEYYGVNIDVFPIDSFPNDHKEQKKFLRRMYWLRKLLRQKRVKRTGVFIDDTLRKIGRFLMKRYSVQVLSNLIAKHATTYNDQDTDYRGIIVWGYGSKEVCRTQVFEGDTKVEFEGKEYNAPAGYKEYLSTVYGDYMQLPPLEKQKRPHIFKAFLRDK